MKTQILRSKFGGALMAMALLTVASTIAPAQTTKENPSTGSTIQGVWRTMVTPVDCVTGGELAPPFPGLFTFNKGGTMSEYGIAPGQTPALRSPGHGIWQHEGSRNYSFAFTFYRYDASGVFLGRQKVTATLELGPTSNEFTTASTVEIFDVDDNLIATFCAMAAGTRFE